MPLAAMAPGMPAIFSIQPSTTPPQPLELEQYGGSVGGPILKNKLFYFATFERQTYDVGTALSEKIPTSSAGVRYDQQHSGCRGGFGRSRNPA